MLYKALSQYASQGVCPMHMPGHKRNTRLLGNELPYEIDITEIDGFDNLHAMQGILKDTADAAAALYGSKKTFLLINGSTGGILAAIRGMVKRADKIVMARNCHKSVYNAAELNCLNTVYLAPQIDRETGICGSITPEQVAAVLETHPDTRLVVLTSPTYAGVISDIRSICDIAHKKAIPVLVDQAHGAHLGFSDMFPGEALKSGADVVVTSIHKTLSALTQCALAHVGGNLIDESKLAQQLAVFETSSPSYVLLASIDNCVRLLAEQNAQLFHRYESNIRLFDESVKPLKKLKVLCHGSDTLLHHGSFFLFDLGKIVISTGNTNLTGHSLADLLRRQYSIELEMAGADYAIAMTSICDTTENFVRLAQALIEIDRIAEKKDTKENAAYSVQIPTQKKSICEALDCDGGQLLLLEEAVGAMSLESVWAYPPGIPLIVPGEVIDPDLIQHIGYLTCAGIKLYSTKGQMPHFIYAKRWQGVCNTLTN